MPVKCKHCESEIKGKDVAVCSQCGSTMCADCYSKSGGVCEYCSGDMNYLQ